MSVISTNTFLLGINMSVLGGYKSHLNKVKKFHMAYYGNATDLTKRNIIL